MPHSRRRGIVRVLAFAAAIAAMSLVAPPPAQAVSGAAASGTFQPTAGRPFQPQPMWINGPLAPRSYEFKVPLPPGGSLAPISGSHDPSDGVRVLDAKGSTIGTYETAWAADAAAALLPTAYAIDGDVLRQTVAFDAKTVFPVLVQPSYAPAGAGRSTINGVISIPAGYPNPTWRESLRDYCTSAPEWFGEADFRGPCARHDVCYHNGVNRPACDSVFWGHLLLECQFAYYDVWEQIQRGACNAAASTYYAVVRTKTFFEGNG